MTPTGDMTQALRARPVVAPAVYECRDLVKRREAAGEGFELRVPRLRILQGEVILVHGPSGCGKSTLLDLLALALRPSDAAEFRFRPEPGPVDVMALWRSGRLDALGRLRGKHLGYVLQTGGLLPFLNVRDNIALGCRLLGKAPEPAATQLAERLGIAMHLNKSPLQLSVGERQRVAIARALAHRPTVLLADEPTASVDPLAARGILALMLELVREAGVTAVIATHDREWVPTAAQPNGAPTVPVRVLEHRLERGDALTRSLFWT
ncbi:ABC transporter ATP-binding protein [Thiohalocapsa sp. ML1]|uniref:ABC transporter ATP-binding protein n=1 Tax=Thiohalocapsa sp. ML1 TaxID=1431688 RepID=UPI000AF8CDEF|nr:ATP-binding cassette domain-containing protein [Thiohalocapsa sp. ML1]